MNKKKRHFDLKLNKIKELERKVQAVLNDEKAKVLRAKPYQKPVSSHDAVKKGKASTMTGFPLAASDKLGSGSRRIASVTQYLKNLDM